MKRMHWQSMAELRDAVTQNRDVARDVLEHFVARARRFATLNAFVTVQPVLNEMRADVNSRLALPGVPLAVKDLVDVEQQVTTAASRVYAENRATRDAEVIGRSRALGASFVGKTNLHEFAYGGSGVISAYGPALNPWNTACITGGSSSGSAAAVAAGLCVGAIGTDTAGSIRLPASLCGIVGFKPTFGVVSAEGVVPLSRSYDHVGPMTRTVADARLLFSAMTGREASAEKRTGRLRVGVAEQFFFHDLDPEVASATDEVLGVLSSAGHTVVRRDFDADEDRTLSSYEAYVYHKPLLERFAELYQPETLRRIRSGEKTTEEQAQRAAEKLQSLRAGAATIFEGIDVLLTPTVPIVAPRLADVLEHPETLRPKELVMLRNTRPFNVLGVPTISVPCDLSRDGLPIGIQLAAAPGKDFELLDIAEEFERLAPWQHRLPPGFD